MCWKKITQRYGFWFVDTHHDVLFLSIIYSTTCISGVSIGWPFLRRPLLWRRSSYWDLYILSGNDSTLILDWCKYRRLLLWSHMNQHTNFAGNSYTACWNTNFEEEKTSSSSTIKQHRSEAQVSSSTFIIHNWKAFPADLTACENTHRHPHRYQAFQP